MRAKLSGKTLFLGQTFSLHLTHRFLRENLGRDLERDLSNDFHHLWLLFGAERRGKSCLELGCQVIGLAGGELFSG